MREGSWLGSGMTPHSPVSIESECPFGVVELQCQQTY